MRSKSSSGRSWSEVRVSDFSSNSFNPIRNIMENMKLSPNPELTPISLALGDPTVFGNMGPSATATQAVVDALVSSTANGYGPSHGLKEARKAVAEYIGNNAKHVLHRMSEHKDNFDPECVDRVTEEDVVITSGCSSALDMCIGLLANRGDNILIPRPGFPLYKTLAQGMGVETREYRLEENRDFEIDLEHLESLIDDKTRALIITNPSNPCGSVYSIQHLISLLALAEKHCLPIIADEIYEHFVFDGIHVPLATLRSPVPILTCSGLTKRFLVPGWRLGWLSISHICEDTSIIDALRSGLHRLSQRIIGANIPVQKALPTILKSTPQSFFDDTLTIVANNANLAHQKLSATKGLRVASMPKGAMYMMVAVDMELFGDMEDDVQFVQNLYQEQSVFVLPGQCFGADNFVRIVLTLPQMQLEQALKRIDDFCNKHVINDNNDDNNDVYLNKGVDRELVLMGARKVRRASDTDEDADSGASCDDDFDRESIEQCR